MFLATVTVESGDRFSLGLSVSLSEGEHEDPK